MKWLLTVGLVLLTQIFTINAACVREEHTTPRNLVVSVYRWCDDVNGCSSKIYRDRTECQRANDFYRRRRDYEDVVTIDFEEDTSSEDSPDSTVAEIMNSYNGEGIYKVDEGVYTFCEFNRIGRFECNAPTKRGIFNVRNDEGLVVCDGYYRVTCAEIRRNKRSVTPKKNAKNIDPCVVRFRNGGYMEIPNCKSN